MCLRSTAKFAFEIAGLPHVQVYIFGKLCVSCTVESYPTVIRYIEQ